MKAFSSALIATSVLAAGPSLAQSMPGMPGMSHNTTARTGQGVGVITAIDARAGKITIKHGPIPAVGWPAMTMTFRAAPRKLLGGVKVGQTVSFDVRTLATDAEVTAIWPR